MRGAVALARMELRRNFRGPVGFAVAGLFLLVHGIYFVSLLENYSGSSFMAMSASQTPARLNLVDAVLQPLASGDTFLLLLLLPGLTMRLLSEEWRSGTSDLLLSYPLSESEIVVGKFLAAAAMLAGLLVLSLLAPLSASFFGAVELPTVFTQFLGLLLFGLCCLALGTFFSALTANQILAYGATVVVLFSSWFLGWWSQNLYGIWARITGWMSLASHFNPTSYGIIQLSDLVYFLGITAFCLYLATSVLSSRRAGR